MEQRYVILDAEGHFANLIVWDGVTEWSPPEGCTLVAEDSAEGQAALSAHLAQQQAEQEALRAQAREGQ